MRRVRFLPLVAVLAAVQPAASAMDAQGLLRAMHEATRELNYDGVFVYQRGMQLDSMRLVHQATAQGEKERLISLSGPAREVIRDGSLVTCLFADDEAAMVEKTAPRDLVGLGFSAPIETLLDSYAFAVEGRDRVAGRDALVVAVTPQSDDRYGYRLWVDEASKLLLKSVILGRGGRVLEQVQFTHLEILEQVQPERLEPEIAGSGFTWRTDEGEQDNAHGGGDGARRPWQVNWVPRGFELKEDDVQNMATSQMPVEHLVYTDGLAMVSVFVEKLMPDEPPMQGYSARGAVNAFSRVHGDHQITVVGEVPLPTVRQIASSVARNQN
ncbi:MAG: MucB/RseB C-terminal domain-containing protein [Gammaproteobacteria bacterium]